MKKKIISIFLCLSVFLSLGAVAASAADMRTGDARAVIGADVSADQKALIYQYFGIDQGSVTELTLTNAEEHQALDGYVDSSVIGTHSYSCVYVEKLAEGEGLQVATYNIDWCTQEMYLNALVTAGVEDVKVVVAAPFEVSGTAALAGVYKAYEDMTGEPIDDACKLVSTQELVVTGELADQIGSYDASEIVSDLKLVLDETVSMSDDELSAQIDEIAKEYNVTLTESQKIQLISLCRQMEKLDVDQLKEKVIYAQETVKKLAAARDKISVLTERVQEIVTTIQNVITQIVNFFSQFTKK